MCSVVGSALPLLRQTPSDQHPAPSSNLALASPGTVEMNKSNLKRNMPSRLLHSATVTILGRHVQTKVTSCRAVMSATGVEAQILRGCRHAMKWRGCPPNRQLPLLGRYTTIGGLQEIVNANNRDPGQLLLVLCAGGFAAAGMVGGAQRRYNWYRPWKLPCQQPEGIWLLLCSASGSFGRFDPWYSEAETCTVGVTMRFILSEPTYQQFSHIQQVPFANASYLPEYNLQPQVSALPARE
jgi:hypothetical protein